MRVPYIVHCLILASASYASLAPTTTLKTIVVRRDGEPPVTTIGVPGNDHQLGDVIITIPEADNKVLAQIVSQNVCPDSKLRKRFVNECFRNNGRAMYDSMRSGGMRGLVDMANGGFELPLPPPELEMGATNEFELMTGAVPGLNDRARGRLGRIVWWAQYPALIMHVTPSNPVKVIPAVVATRVAPAPAATSSARCHYPDRIPYCVNCGNRQSDTGTTCVGFGELWRMCPCLKHTEVPPSKPFYLPIPAYLQTFLASLNEKPKVTCLGMNATQDVELWRKLAVKACENQDVSKGFLREGLTVADIDDSSKYQSYQGYKYMFRWEPKDDLRCTKDCKSLFNPLTKCGDGSKSEMAKTGASESRCGTVTYKIEDRVPAKIACRGKSIQAPRGDKESNSATSLDKAIEQFCTDNDGKVVKKGDNVYQRYGITELGVPERSSFWLRGAITCGEEERMKKSDCIQALKDGMERCDPNYGYSHGLAASVGCMDYSIDQSLTALDDSPPWAEKIIFPPPIDAAKPGGGEQTVECFKSKYRRLTEDDVNKAIHASCQKGANAEIKGFGSRFPDTEYMFDFPEPGTPQFYDNDRYTMHLTTGAILNDDIDARTNDLKNWKPYEEMRWCDNYDYKMREDDCTFALRSIYKKCAGPDYTVGGQYIYRCVRYSSYPINLRKD